MRTTGNGFKNHCFQSVPIPVPEKGFPSKLCLSTVIKIVVEIFYEYDTPCMIYSVFGPVTAWLRYIEWLLTCPVSRSTPNMKMICLICLWKNTCIQPLGWSCLDVMLVNSQPSMVSLRGAQVILIHLSNLTGLDEEYSARTMNLLTSDQGTICFGVTAALCNNGWIKVRTVETGDMTI